MNERTLLRGNVFIVIDFFPFQRRGRFAADVIYSRLGIQEAGLPTRIVRYLVLIFIVYD